MTDILHDACERAAEYGCARLNRMPRPHTFRGSVSLYDRHGILLGSWDSRHIDVLEYLAPPETRAATAVHFTYGRFPWAMCLSYWLDDAGTLKSQAAKVQFSESDGKWRALKAERVAHIDQDPVREVVGRTLHLCRPRYLY